MFTWSQGRSVQFVSNWLVTSCYKQFTLNPLLPTSFYRQVTSRDKRKLKVKALFGHDDVHHNRTYWPITDKQMINLRRHSSDKQTARLARSAAICLHNLFDLMTWKTLLSANHTEENRETDFASISRYNVGGTMWRVQCRQCRGTLYIHLPSPQCDCCWTHCDWCPSSLLRTIVETIHWAHNTDD